METIDKIINTLKNKHIIQEQVIEWTEIKSGTTDGTIYRLSSEKKPLYVLKKDEPKVVAATNGFLETYKNIKLLPNVLYTDEFNEFYTQENVKIDIRLLLKLSNILNLESLFNGFCLYVPFFIFTLDFIHFIICQSPLIHLFNLVM